MSNSIGNQRLKILSYLQSGKSLTTFYGRNKLGICHPAARIQELKQRGHDIQTHWITEADATGRTHRIAKYVLHYSNENEGQHVD